MSLQYERELEEVETPAEDGEPEVEMQRADPIFPLYSVILIACLIVVTTAQFIVDGLDALVFGGEKSILLAGFVKPLFFEGQYWRILTGAALHGGLMHLGFNCYALYILGKLIETLSNRAHLAIVFLLSAIGGGILSLYFLPENASIGASGGVIGFLGYLTVYGFKRRKLLSNDFLKNMLFNVGFIAVFGVFILPNIDNFGHLGGLLTGALYGLIQIPSNLYEDPREAGNAAKLTGIAALGIFILACIFADFVMLTGNAG